MNKKTFISATNTTMRKLKTLAGEKVGVKNKMVVTSKRLGLKDKRVAVKVEKGNDIYKNKKTAISETDNTILKLRVSAKKKEGVRSRLVVTAREKEVVRSKLATTAKKLAGTAREKE